MANAPLRAHQNTGDDKLALITSGVSVSPAIRATKREQVREFFTQRLGQQFTSIDLHVRYGTGVKARISELNRDPCCLIVIKNSTDANDCSIYWAELKPKTEPSQQSLPMPVGTESSRYPD